MTTTARATDLKPFELSPAGLKSIAAVQRARLEKVLKVAGARYTPKLNVDLPISSVFDGLGRTPAFFTRIRTIQGRVQRAYSRCRPRGDVVVAQAEYRALDDSIAPVFDFFRKLSRFGDREIPFNGLQERLREFAEAAWKCDAELRRPDSEQLRDSAQAGHPVVGWSDAFSTERHYLSSLRMGNSRARTYLRSTCTLLCLCPHLSNSLYEGTSSV